MFTEGKLVFPLTAAHQRGESCENKTRSAFTKRDRNGGVSDPGLQFQADFKQPPHLCVPKLSDRVSIRHLEAQ